LEARLSQDLGLFPPESRALTEPLLLALQQTNAGPPKSTKESGTIRLRRIHYLMFAHDMKWGNDDLCYTMECDNRCQLLQLALYAQHLGTGNTIFCRSVKVATVKAYTNAAASLMALFGDHPRDFRKEVPTNAHVSRVLSTVHDKLHRWETVPNRREPFAPEMLRDIQQRATNMVNCRQPDSLLSALANWFKCALFADFDYASGHKMPTIRRPTAIGAICTSTPKLYVWVTSGSRVRAAPACL
jgi:hypothetical protein